MSRVSIDPAFIFGSAGAGEWIVLFIVVLIVVGPKRLPDVARKLGRMMEMFRRAADEFKRQIMTMDQPPPPPYDPPPTQTDYDTDGSSDPYGDAGLGDDPDGYRYENDGGDESALPPDEPSQAETSGIGGTGESGESGNDGESGASSVPGDSPAPEGGRTA